MSHLLEVKRCFRKLLAMCMHAPQSNCVARPTKPQRRTAYSKDNGANTL